MIRKKDSPLKTSLLNRRQQGTPPKKPLDESLDFGVQNPSREHLMRLLRNLCLSSPDFAEVIVDVVEGKPETVGLLEFAAPTGSTKRSRR